VAEGRYCISALASNTHVIICAAYRSGSSAPNDIKLFEHLDQVIPQVRSQGSKLIVAGDFNVHNRLWLGSNKTTLAGEFAEDVCNLHGLTQHVSQPTRGDNILDLIMSDFPSNVKVSSQPPLGCSDHITLIADFPTLPSVETPTSRTVWRYNQADWPRLCHHFRTFDWNSIFTNSPEESCRNVTATILAGMKRFIPSRLLVTRPSDPAWWSPECNNAVERKSQAWERARRARF